MKSSILFSTSTFLLFDSLRFSDSISLLIFFASLFINVHINYGIYFRHESNAVKLSVFDKSKLNEIVWTKDVCDFSMGLFLPPELAWKGIKEFLKTGTASTEIEWISPNDIPKGGNY